MQEKQSHSAWVKVLLRIRDVVAKLTAVEVENLKLLPSKIRVQQLYSFFWPSLNVAEVLWDKLVHVDKVSRLKVSFCVWLVCLNRLPTKAWLYIWGLTDDNSCSLCHNTIETRDHLFCGCPTVQPILT